MFKKLLKVSATFYRFPRAGAIMLLPFILSGILFSSCTHLFYHPSKENFPLPPQMQPIPYKDIFFKSQDGVRLHGRLFLTQKLAKGTLVQFHGNAENLTSHFISLSWLIQHGYNLFTFDYRGYGQSESSPSPRGIRRDALAALQQAKQIHQSHAPQGKFIIIGQSLGGAVALRAIEDFPGDKHIDLVVLDSSFSSYQKIAFKKLTSHWLTWPLSPLAYILISDKTSANLQNFRQPLLVIHSENDPVVPFECGKSIYRQANSLQKTFWRGKEKGHIMGFYSQQRQKRFLKFLSSTR